MPKSARKLFLHMIIFLKTSIPTCRFEKKYVIIQLLEAWASTMLHATYTPGQSSYVHLTKYQLWHVILK